MIRLNSIREFINLIPTCQFCRQPHSVQLVDRGNHTPNIFYSMTFDTTKFSNGIVRDIVDGDPRKPTTQKVVPQIKYTSDFDGKYLRFYYYLDSYYKNDDRKNLIFSVDVDTNEVIGSDVDRLQKIFWDYKELLLKCTNEKCHPPGNIFMMGGESLFLERKKKRLLPFRISHEFYLVVLKDKSYQLISSPILNETQLIFGAETLESLPYIPLHSIRGMDAIINKIKTIITFS